MTCLITPFKQLVSKLVARFRKCDPENPAISNNKYENARMSYTRLQALEGAGYRQCYMEKLRETSDAPTTESKERWFGEANAEPVTTVEAEAEKQRQKLVQAQHKMSYTRLQALVQQLPPDERLMNEEEARRLGGVAMPGDDSKPRAS
jgi:hypothetical protein